MSIVLDISGKRYGRWTILEFAGIFDGHRSKWLCRCDCGVERTVLAANLRNGSSKSCGCLCREHISEVSVKRIEGGRYGRLLVVKRVLDSSSRHAKWLCRCECGREVIVAGIYLRNGNTKSCGCLIGHPRSLLDGEANFNALFKMMERQALIRGYRWELSREQVATLTKQKCYYCNIEPRQRMNGANSNGIYVYNGIDRVDNTKDYTIDNVVACCGRCNRAKSDMTIDKFKAWINDVYNHFVQSSELHALSG